MGNWLLKTGDIKDGYAEVSIRTNHFTTTE